MESRHEKNVEGAIMLTEVKRKKIEHEVIDLLMNYNLEPGETLLILNNLKASLKRLTKRIKRTE